MSDENNTTVELATELTIAWLSNPNTRASAEDVPAFLSRMHQAVTGLTVLGSREAEQPSPEYTPAVSARKSLASRDHIISMIDGKPYKTLRRHLGNHGLTPEQYRERYGLKGDDPMVAENYAQIRRDLAKKIGLGRKRRPADEPAAAGKRGRSRKGFARRLDGFSCPLRRRRVRPQSSPLVLPRRERDRPAPSTQGRCVATRAL